MKCLHPYLDKTTGQQFNCGKCVNCRATRGSQWKLRNIYELDDWDSAIFLTLTMSDEWLEAHNPTCSLQKKEAQKFVKRMREWLREEYGEHDVVENGSVKLHADGTPYKELNHPFKIFLCGEYSPRKPSRNSSRMCPMGERPHYHAIVFGLDRYDDATYRLIKDCWCPPQALRCEPWQFDRARGKKDGIQDVTMETIGYVTDYASKKLYGDYAKAEYEDRGREPPFHINSQGLGLNFAMKNAERLRRNNYGLINGQKIGLPKYLRDKLESEIVPRNENPIIKKIRLKEENEYLRKLFEDDKKITLSDTNLDWYNRQFERWYDEHRYEYCNIIFENFKKKQKLKGVIE